MKKGTKIAIVLLLATAVAATFALRKGERARDAATLVSVVQATVKEPSPPSSMQEPGPATAPPVAPIAAAATPAQQAVAATAKPRIIEFGSNRCMACQQMAAVLDTLRASQGEKLQVDFLDVMENPELGKPYKVLMIPTQILFDAAGKELYRHTGFMSHDDILAKFRELGVQL